MTYINTYTKNNDCVENAKLYEFLAVDYDISDLAKKICAAKNAKINLLNLKKIR